MLKEELLSEKLRSCLLPVTIRGSISSLRWVNWLMVRGSWFRYEHGRGRAFPMCIYCMEDLGLCCLHSILLDLLSTSLALPLLHIISHRWRHRTITRSSVVESPSFILICY